MVEESRARGQAVGRDARTPFLGGIVFAVASTLLGLTLRDQSLGEAIVSGVLGGLVFAVVWFMMIRLRRSR